MFLVCAIVVGLLVLSEHVENKKARHRHRQSHPPITDDEFLAGAGIASEHRHIALGVRDGIAESMGVPPSTVYADDAIAYIKHFHSLGPDWMAIQMGIEDALKVRFQRKSLPSRFEALLGGKTLDTATQADFEAITVADLAGFLIANWDLATPQKNSTANRD